MITFWTERDGGGNSLAYTATLSQDLCRATRKDDKHLSQYNRSSYLNLNPRFPEYASRVPATQQRSSLRFVEIRLIIIRTPRWIKSRFPVFPVNIRLYRSREEDRIFWVKCLEIFLNSFIKIPRQFLQIDYILLLPHHSQFILHKLSYLSTVYNPAS